MAQLMQVLISQIIDKRIAKFTTKGSPLKSVASLKDSRNVKLQPLSILKNPKLAYKSGGSPTQINRRIKVKASNTMKNDESANENDFATSENLAASIVDSYENNLNLDHSIEEIQQKINEDESEINSNESEEFIENQQIIYTDQEISLFWTNFYTKIYEMHKKPMTQNFHWVLYQTWKKIMKRGVQKILKNWKIKISSIIKIQKN